jgi:hypothetical protein
VDIVLDRPDLVDFLATALDDINGSRDFHFQVSRDSKFQRFKIQKDRQVCQRCYPETFPKINSIFRLFRGVFNNTPNK